MIFRRSSVLSAALAAMLLVPATACSKKKTTPPEHHEDDIDATAKNLVWELRVGEREQLAASFPDLAAQIDERDLVVLSRTLTWLGQEQSFKRTGEVPVVDGVERTYAIELAQGTVELTIEMVGGKLIGFSFDEPSWDSYVDQSAAAAAGKLKISDFRYVDRNGKPLTGALDPAAINYELVLEGLGASFHEHHVAIAKSVFDSSGRQVYRQHEPDEVKFSQSETGASGGRISGTVAVPGPGKYELHLDIRDLTDEQTLTHSVPFSID